MAGVAAARAASLLNVGSFEDSPFRRCLIRALAMPVIKKACRLFLAALILIGVAAPSGVAIAGNGRHPGMVAVSKRPDPRKSAVCPPWCQADFSACDPPAFKPADQRCSQRI